MTIENKNNSLTAEAFKTPLKIPNLNLEAIEALELIAAQSDNKQNKKIANKLIKALLVEEKEGKFTYFPPKTKKEVGIEVHPFIWSGGLLGKNLEVFLKAIFPDKDQEEVVGAIREKREIFFKLREKLEIPVKPVNPYASVKVRSLYNEFSEKKKNKQIGNFTYDLSQSLCNKEEIEIPRDCLEAENDLRRLLKITFGESKDGKTRRRQVVNLLKKGKKIVLKVK